MGVEPPAVRRQRHRQEVLDAILQAARDVMRADGVAGLSLHAVARRVGLRAPSLYEYVDGKAGLYDALFLLGVRLFADYVAHARAELTARGGSAFDRLRARLTLYMTFAQEQPDLYALVFERPVPGFVPSEASMAASRELLATSRADWLDLLSMCKLRPTVSPEQSHDLFLAVQHGLTALHLANEPHLPPGQGRFGGLVEAALTLFATGWGPATHAPPPSSGGSRP